MMYYSIFTPKVTAEQAVLKAVNYCIEHDIMKKFMEEHRQEVVNMFTEEWNLEEAKRVAAEEATAKAKAETTEKIRIESIRNVMDSCKWSIEQAMAALKIPETDYPKYISML